MSNTYNFLDMVKKLANATECNVLFKKADGTERHMRCTLNESRIPKDEFEKDIDVTNENLDYITVWDLDKNDWRRFRVDSVKSFVDTF